MPTQDDYESRIDRLRTTIRSCLDAHEVDEDFFSASDGGEDSLPQSRDDHTAAAVDGTAACTPSIGITSGATVAEDGRGQAESGCSPLPAHHERGPTSQTEHKVRLVSTPNSSLMDGAPNNGNAILPDMRWLACSTQEATEEAEQQSGVAGRSSASNTSDESAAAQTASSHEHCCGVVSFAGISVSGLRLKVKEMPIFPDVDGVLFELLLAATPRDPIDGRAVFESIDASGDIGSTGRPSHLEGSCLEPAAAANCRSDRTVGVGGDDTSLGESEVEGKRVGISDCLGSDRTTDSRSFTFVGAVALLLSEVVEAWREIQSPLFDSAGGVAGTIKLAARMLREGVRRTQEADTNGLRENNRHVGGAEAMKPEASRFESGRKSTAAGVSAAKAAKAAEAVTSPLATSGLARSRNSGVSPVNCIVKPRGGWRGQRGVSAPTSTCCDRSRGSCRVSHGPAPIGPVEQRGFLSYTAAAVEGRQFKSVRANELAPRATIIYRGVKLPFRWFRSGTAKAMDDDLREMLGINDESIASPLLYDVSTGDRVSLKPGTASGRTFLAVLERHPSQTKSSSEGPVDVSVEDGVTPPSLIFDRRRRPPSRRHHQFPPLLKALSPYRHRLARDDQRHYRHGNPRGESVGSTSGRFRNQDQASGRSRPPSTGHAPRNHALLRRSASVGDVQWSSSKLAIAKSSTAREQAAVSAKHAQFNIRAGGTRFAEEVIELRQHRHPQLERDRFEADRRQEQEHAKAKAMACQLACRVLCRGHRTRVLGAALWRWRLQAAGLKMEHDRRDEQRRGHHQAIALVERLRQEVASLTASTYEELVAVSIDALETELHTPSAAGTGDRSTNDPATECTPPDTAGREDEESVNRAVAALKRDISRLTEVGAQKSQCLRVRLNEQRGVQEVGPGDHGTHSTTTAPGACSLGGVEEKTPPLLPRTPTSFSPKRIDARSIHLPESQQVKQKRTVNGVNPEHPGNGMGTQPGSPTTVDQTKRGVGANAGVSANAGASAGADGSVLPGLPSSPSKMRAAGIGRDGGKKGIRQTVQGDGWGTIREPGSDDEVLECFLAGHVKEGVPPLGEGTRQQSPRRSAIPITEERDLENGAVESERDTKVLWALFQVFSDCPALSPSKLFPLSPCGADGDAAHLLSTNPDVRDHTSRRQIDLPAFLEVCRRAGLLSPAAKVAGPHRDEGPSARGAKRERGRQAKCGRGRGREGDGGGARGRLEEAEAEENVATPGERFFLLSPADAAGVFARTARRYGSADAAVHNRTKQSRSSAYSQSQQQHARWGRLRRGHRECRSHAEEGLDFEQFSSAVGGVIELLTVGCDGVVLKVGDLVGGNGRARLSSETAVFPGDLSPRRSERDSGEIGVNRRRRPDTSSACRSVAELGGKGAKGGCSNGEEGNRRETDGGGSSERRMTAMTPELARNRFVRLAEALAGQELQARDRQARETLALLDPSLQSLLDVNQELLYKVFARYCNKYNTLHGRDMHSPRPKNDNVLGTAKFGDGGGGAGRMPRLTTPTLSLDGGKAFATDVGLVASARQLAEVWDVAWSHQRMGNEARNPLDQTRQVLQQAPIHSPVASKVLSFSGFLDFLGRCALRFGQRTADNNRRRRRRKGWADSAALPVPSATGEFVRTTDLGRNGGCQTGGSDTCGQNSSPGLSMLTLLRLMDTPM